MGPKTKFTREQIIDVAFELACTIGVENITLRKIADQLGSSVAPIYVNFTDSNELLQEVTARAQAIAVEMTREAYTDRPFLNIGIGTLKFAREYSTLFKSLLYIHGGLVQQSSDTRETMLAQMKQDQRLQGFSDQDLTDMLFKMSIFTHGLASMASANMLPEVYDEQKLIELMKSTGEDIIMATRLKKGEKK